jgi:predicted nucleotidyltransferase
VRLAEVVTSLDPEAEVYLFGSVAEGRHLYSSDVDVLIVTERLSPGEVIAALKKEGFDDPFEIHVVDRSMLELYERRSKLIKL